jgi:hypothetical protein
VNPDFTNEPVFPNTVAVPDEVYAVESVGTDPPVDPFPSYDTENGDHNAYNVVFAAIANVPPDTYFVDVPAALIVQPSNAYPARTNEPVFPNTVTLVPLAYEPESVGTDPPVEPFPSYVTA